MVMTLNLIGEKVTIYNKKKDNYLNF